MQFGTYRCTQARVETVDEGLLNDPEAVGNEEVDHDARGNRETEEQIHQRHDLGHPLHLLGVGIVGGALLRVAATDLVLLEVAGAHQADDHQQERDRADEVVGEHLARGPSEVEAERHHLAVGILQRLSQRAVLGQVFRVEVAGLVLAGQVVKQLVHDEEHRHLHQQRKTAPEGRRAVFPHQGEGLLALLLAVVRVTLLDLLELGLELAHRRHRSRRLRRQGEGDRVDRDRQQNDRHAVRGHECVEEVEQPCKAVEEHVKHLSSFRMGMGRIGFGGSGVGARDPRRTLPTGCIVPGGGGRASSLARRRGPPTPRVRRSNNSDGTGTVRRARRKPAGIELSAR